MRMNRRKKKYMMGALFTVLAEVWIFTGFYLFGDLKPAKRLDPDQAVVAAAKVLNRHFRDLRMLNEHLKMDLLDIKSAAGIEDSQVTKFW